MTIKNYLGAAVALTTCFGAATEEAPGTLVGIATFIDGDTIEIDGERVRLSGIDALESGKRCSDTNVYQAGALALSDFLRSQTVECA